MGQSAEATDTRDQILALARSLFSEYGYRGTTVRHMTSQLNLTPAALYYHFSGKDDVLAGVLGPLEQGGADLLERMTELERTPDTIRQVLDLYYDVLAREIVAFRLIADDVDVQKSSVGQRLRAQARDLFGWLVGVSPEVDARIRAAAAVGTIRLSLEQRGVDPDMHHETIVGRAMRIMTD